VELLEMFLQIAGDDQGVPEVFLQIAGDDQGLPDVFLQIAGDDQGLPDVFLQIIPNIYRLRGFVTRATASVSHFSAHGLQIRASGRR
jgi:hypothetical protein